MKFLPIGSIVTLKTATKKILIIGYLPQENGSDEVYDYSGVPYPEGLVDSKKLLLFNHIQIEEVNHKSLEDEETKDFLKRVSEIKEEEDGSI